jgi:hypothetical protein
MLWIHGGGFLGGSGSEDDYAGASLVALPPAIYPIIHLLLLAKKNELSGGEPQNVTYVNHQPAVRIGEGADMSAGHGSRDPPPVMVEDQDYSVRLALLAAIVESPDDAIVSKP